MKCTEEAGFHVNCLISTWLPCLRKGSISVKPLCSTFPANDTHLGCNGTFPPGASMDLIFATHMGRWKRTKVMGASEVTLTCSQRETWKAVAFSEHCFVLRQKIVIILREQCLPDGLGLRASTFTQPKLRTFLRSFHIEC